MFQLADLIPMESGVRGALDPSHRAEADFIPEKPIMLFEGAFLNSTPARMYDVDPDGRFLMIQPISAQAGARDSKIFPSTLRIIINWTAELKAVARKP
jgi:hypothetical protein